MKVTIISGLNAAPGANGLSGYGDQIVKNRPHWEIKYQIWQDEILSTDIVIAHSYGVAAVMKALKDRDRSLGLIHLFAIDGVPCWDFNQYQTSQWDNPVWTQQADFYARLAIFPPWSSLLKKPNEAHRNHFYFWPNHVNIIEIVKEDVLARVFQYE